MDQRVKTAQDQGSSDAVAAYLNQMIAHLGQHKQAAIVGAHLAGALAGGTLGAIGGTKAAPDDPYGGIGGALIGGAVGAMGGHGIAAHLDQQGSRAFMQGRQSMRHMPHVDELIGRNMGKLDEIAEAAKNQVLKHVVPPVQKRQSRAGKAMSDFWYGKAPDPAPARPSRIGQAIDKAWFAP